ncbi:MAG: XRE family transcriptional regulator, partial [Sphingobacteriaceae bacterium]
RHKAALDQFQVASKLAISVAEYSKMESFRKELNPAVLEQLIQVFGLSREAFAAWPGADEKFE